MDDKQSSSIISWNTCRCCGIENKLDGVNLCGSDKRRINCLLKMLSLLPAEVINFDISDGFSKYICADCELILSNLSKFCEMVRKTQKSMKVLFSKASEDKIHQENKSKECHNLDTIRNESSITINFGNNGVVKCNSCGYDLIYEELIALEIASYGLETVVCVCLLCGHRSNISSFLHNKDNVPCCPQCYFICYKQSEHSQSKMQMKKNYECNICFKTFRCKSHCDRHKMIHSGAKPFLCETCGAGFNQKHSLKLHMLGHSGLNPHKCLWCTQSFRFKLSLESHEINVHPEAVRKEAKIQCDRCSKQFVSKYKLQRHHRSHTGVRPYKCEFCDKVFSQAGNLKAHIKKHEIEDKFSRNFESNDQHENASLKSLGAIFDKNCPEPKEFISLDQNNERNRDSGTFSKDGSDLFSNFSPQQVLFEDDQQTLPTFKAIYRLT